MKNKKLIIFIASAEILLLLFITYPILLLIFTTSPGDLTLSLRDRAVWYSIGITILTATIATVVGLLAGIPAAYFIARSNSRWSRLLENIMVLPTLIPHVIVGIIFVLTTASSNPAGYLMGKLGISLVDSLYGIVAVMLFVSITYIINSGVTGFNSFPGIMEEVAYSHGVSAATTFFKVSLPLAGPSIIRGAILSFARSISETGAFLILATYPRTAQVLIYNRFITEGLKKTQGIAVIVTVISFTLLLLLIMNRRAVWHEQ